MSSNVLIELEIRKWQHETTQKYHLYVKVIRYENIPAEIFVYRRHIDAPPTEQLDFFSNIASPTQLVTLPKHSHQPGNIFYIDNYVELSFDTAQQREDTEAFMLTDIGKLKDDWVLVMDQLTTTYTVIV